MIICFPIIQGKYFLKKVGTKDVQCLPIIYTVLKVRMKLQGEIFFPPLSDNDKIW